MRNNVRKLLKKSEVEFAVVDKETAERIHKLAKTTDESATALLNAAVQILEKSLGRELTVHKPNSKWRLKINHLTKYKTAVDFEPKDE